MNQRVNRVTRHMRPVARFLFGLVFFVSSLLWHLSARVIKENCNLNPAQNHVYCFSILLKMYHGLLSYKIRVQTKSIVQDVFHNIK